MFHGYRRMRVLLVAALVCVAVANASERVKGSFERYDWAAYKEKWNKSYLTKAEDDKRRMLYLDNLMMVNVHNREYDQGKHTYWMAVNPLADMTEDEIIAQKTGVKLPKNMGDSPVRVPSEKATPDAINWVEKGAVQHVKDQGQCGSCWAFGTCGAFEGQYFVKYGKLIDCAEQQLVSCSGPEYDTEGCNGGWMNGAMDYVRDNGENGIDTQASYPYTARDDTCDTAKTQDGQDVATTCPGGHILVETNEAAVMEAVGNLGPIVICIDCNSAWRAYSGGIFDDPSCRENGVLHAVTLCGYDNNQKYWLIKNSWNTWWGDQGYMKMVKDKSGYPYGMCGIAQYPMYPGLD